MCREKYGYTVQNTKNSINVYVNKGFCFKRLPRFNEQSNESIENDNASLFDLKLFLKS